MPDSVTVLTAIAVKDGVAITITATEKNGYQVAYQERAFSVPTFDDALKGADELVAKLNDTVLKAAHAVVQAEADFSAYLDEKTKGTTFDDVTGTVKQ